MFLISLITTFLMLIMELMNIESIIQWKCKQIFWSMWDLHVYSYSSAHLLTEFQCNIIIRLYHQIGIRILMLSIANIIYNLLSTHTVPHSTLAIKNFKRVLWTLFEVEKLRNA